LVANEMLGEGLSRVEGVCVPFEVVVVKRGRKESGGEGG